MLIQFKCLQYAWWFFILNLFLQGWIDWSSKGYCPGLSLWKAPKWVIDFLPGIWLCQRTWWLFDLWHMWSWDKTFGLFSENTKPIMFQICSYINPPCLCTQPWMSIIFVSKRKHQQITNCHESKKHCLKRWAYVLYVCFPMVFSSSKSI